MAQAKEIQREKRMMVGSVRRRSDSNISEIMAGLYATYRMAGRRRFGVSCR